MIELKNVSKVYRSKKGVCTNALNNINLSFGSSGLTFIVGKSGSGKSTLLNILGALDTTTSGDIIFNGKSLNSFSKSERDSYRNTCVGFIFQEFNLLEDYNVYENIELSLKLQNKNNIKDIDNLLNIVGLSNYGSRRINELSGGEKQRVGIARALVKNPYYILADEPTGNLDRNSSSQIFNILKEISKTKLVIVVSHDMESAKMYGDRIIEIEDGNVLYDSNSTVDNNNEVITYKKSRLPFKHALKMSLRSFKVRPFRFIMTIILTAISLIFMGFFVNVTIFDNQKYISDFMKENKYKTYFVSKNHISKNEGYIKEKIDIEDINNIKEITNREINEVYSLYDNGDNLVFTFGEVNSSSKYFSIGVYTLNFIEVKDDNIMGKVIGKYPSKDNEIVIHKYLAEYIIKYGIMTSDDKIYFPKDFDELVTSNVDIKLGSNSVNVVGIIDEDNSLFKEMKESNTCTDELYSYFTTNYASKASYIYVKGFTKSAELKENKEAILRHVSLYRKTNEYKYLRNNSIALNKDISIINKNGITNINSIEKDEVIIPIDSLKLLDKDFGNNFNEYITANYGVSYDKLRNDFISKYLNDKEINLCLSIYSIDGSGNVHEKLVKVVGISLDDNIYISQKYVDDYVPSLRNIDSVMVYDEDYKNIENSFSKMRFGAFSYDEGDEIKDETFYSYSFNNDRYVYNIISLYDDINIYVLVVSLVFLLFTFILFSNFISISVSYCKKEIGILRALGAREVDVVKIFLYESLLVGIISWIIAIIGWFTICLVINNNMFNKYYIILKAISTHPLVPFIMLLLVLYCALMVTFAVTKKITSIKPIDAILNK